MMGASTNRQKVARFAGAERTTSGRDHPSAQAMKYFACAMLLVMAVAAAAALRLDVTNYISSLKSVSGLRLDITDIEIADGKNPHVILRFRVQNESPLEIELEGYVFDLYFNGAIFARNYSMYQGRGPDANSWTYAEAQAIDRTLAPGKPLSLEFTLYIYPERMESMNRARLKGAASWEVRSGFTGFLPFSRNRFTVRLNTDYAG